MKNNYARVYRCSGCVFRYQCSMNPLRRRDFGNSASAHFVFFPDLLTEVSLPVLFPELYFYA
ncbi:MAG: hypothetical protein LLG02_00625 [Pelosinus sp.]|nr:hypothetical protein [Pelosinus sp.]